MSLSDTAAITGALSRAHAGVDAAGSGPHAKRRVGRTEEIVKVARVSLPTGVKSGDFRTVNPVFPIDSRVLVSSRAEGEKGAKNSS